MDEIIKQQERERDIDDIELQLLKKKQDEVDRNYELYGRLKDFTDSMHIGREIHAREALKKFGVPTKLAKEAKEGEIVETRSIKIHGKSYFKAEIKKIKKR